MRKIEWKKGTVEYVSALFLVLGILFILLNVFVEFNVREEAEYALFNTARDIVICDSKDDAEKKAAKELKKYMDASGNMDYISSSVDLAISSEELKWEKGNLAELTVTADLHGLIRTKTKSINYIFMIE